MWDRIWSPCDTVQIWEGMGKNDFLSRYQMRNEDKYIHSREDSRQRTEKGNCLACQKPLKRKGAKHCSNACYAITMQGNTRFPKGSKHTKETKIQMSISQKNWREERRRKKDNCPYELHDWLDCSDAVDLDGNPKPYRICLRCGEIENLWVVNTKNAEKRPLRLKE